MQPTILFRRHLAGCGLLIATALASGCATTTVPPAAVPDQKAATPSARQQPEFVPVVRYGRYTLVELAPSSAQQDLLQQVIDVTIPNTRAATVGDALRHVLARSGYQLCASPDVAPLGALPLPAAHYHLGPLVLRDALLILAGPAWDLQVDDRARRVCFIRGTDPSPAPVAPTTTPATAGVGHIERRPLPEVSLP